MTNPLSIKVPSLSVNTSEIKDVATRNAFRDLFRALDILRNRLLASFDIVHISYVSQNAQPAPVEGSWIFWVDADATAGNPKAYLVTTQGGIAYKFASVEVV